MLSFVQAPLYQMLLSFESCFWDRIFSGFSMSFSKVTRWVQLLKIWRAFSTSPFQSLTAVASGPSSCRILLTEVFRRISPPKSVKLLASMLESAPFPPSTYPHSPFRPFSSSPMTWWSSTQAVEGCSIDKFSPMMPSVAKVALSISLSNQPLSIVSTEAVTNSETSKGFTFEQASRFLANFREWLKFGFWMWLQGISSSCCSQASQTPLRNWLYLDHCSESRLLNLAISLSVNSLSLEWNNKYLPCSRVGVIELMSLKCTFRPLFHRSSYSNMLRLNNERTQEQRENLKPGINSSVRAAPPTRCRFSQIRTFLPALAKQLPATRLLWPAPTIIASQACFMPRS